ncbi:MAG TPA: diguanylate cyclase [Burkholderiaceae bacterium]
MYMPVAAGTTPEFGYNVLLNAVLKSVNVGLIALDAQQRIVLWNRWMEQHSGKPAEDVVGLLFAEVFPELMGQRIVNAIHQALEENFPSLLSQTLNKAPFPLYSGPAEAAKGNLMQQAVSVQPIALNDSTRHCMIQITDVSIAVAREKLLREQAMVLRSQTFSDGLTGIANRRHFDVAIEKELRRAKRAGTSLSLLMIDIDYFKPYNDHYGHQRGDECLIDVAHALSAMLQRPTDLVARYGGEEFALILPDTPASNARAVAEAIREKIESLGYEHAQGGQTRKLTVSIGVATRTPELHVEAACLIGAADRALYEAKRGGRNRVAAHEGPFTTVVAATPARRKA